MRPKDAWFIGSSKKDLSDFPDDARQEAGFSIYQAQRGETPLDAKRMKGFGNAKVVEVPITHDGDTYRVVYTVKFAKAVYVLHAFQKKSKRGIATPQQHVDLIKLRLKKAEKDYNARYENRKTDNDDG
jgi:phage-related protein